MYSSLWNKSNFVWTLSVKADFGVWLLDNLSPEHVTNRAPQFSHLYFLDPKKAATLQKATLHNSFHASWIYKESLLTRHLMKFLHLNLWHMSTTGQEISWKLPHPNSVWDNLFKQLVQRFLSHSAVYCCFLQSKGGSIDNWCSNWGTLTLFPGSPYNGCQQAQVQVCGGEAEAQYHCLQLESLKSNLYYRN